MSKAPQTITIVETRITTRTITVDGDWPEEVQGNPKKAREHAACAIRNVGIESISVGTSEVESWVTIDGLDMDEIGQGVEG